MVDEFRKSLENITDTEDSSNSTLLKKEMLENYKVEVAMSLSLLVGIFQILMGLFGLGIISNYFSDSFISSYTCGSAVHVFISQIKDLFGIRGTKAYEEPLKFLK